MEYYEFVDLMSRLPWGERGSGQEVADAVLWLFDHEHDGLASVVEIRRLLTSVGEPLTDEELDMMMKQLSPDGDGNVTCEGAYRQCRIIISGGRAVASNFIWGFSGEGRTNEWPKTTSGSGGVGEGIFFGIFALKWCILLQKQLTLYIVTGFR